MYQTYDIILNEYNQLEVKLYQVDLIREGKKAFYRFTLINSISVMNDNLEEIVKTLKLKNAISIIRFDDSDFSCEFSNSRYALYSLFLPMQHQLLEKVFDEVIIDNCCYINVYVTYVNVNTGKISSLKVKDFGLFAEEKEEQLKRLGFKHISNSYLGNHLDEMNSFSNKPFQLKRRK